MTYLNHFGSLAIGSATIGVSTFIKYLFEFLGGQAIKLKDKEDNKVASFIVSAGSCMLNCIPSFSDYMSKGAYSYMAISAEDFCTSAQNNMLLSMSFGRPFAQAKRLATIFVFVGKIFIVTINCFTLLFFMNIRGDLEEVTSRGGPLFVCAVVSFFTANLFLSMMDNAVSALLICFSVDIGIHKFEPKFGPANFHEAVKELYLSEDNVEKNKSDKKGEEK